MELKGTTQSCMEMSMNCPFPVLSLQYTAARMPQTAFMEPPATSAIWKL